MTDTQLPPLDSAEGRAVSAALSRRLEQLRDEAWMTPVLQTALARMDPSAPTVSGYDIDYCKIKPNRDINLVVNAHVPGEPQPRRLACMVFPTATACRDKFTEESGDTLSIEALRSTEAQGYVEPVTVLDDPAMIIRAFPVDPLLPGLAHATDQEAMKRLFAKHLTACLEDGGEPRGFSYEILHYKPRRSCTLHYTIQLEGTAARAFGKVARDDRGERNHEVLQIAWEAALASGGAWSAARPVTYVPEWKLLLQEAVPGRDFRHVFSELTPDDASETQLREVGSYLENIAGALHALQTTARPDIGPDKTFQRLFREQHKNLLYLRSVEPALAEEIAALRDELERLERRSAPAAPVFCHGDFAHGNVLIDHGRVGIIDFDKAGRAEPAFDMAYFLTHMWSFGIRHPRRMEHVVDLWRQMREAYLDLSEDVTSERLALYEALDFVAYVLRNFRKQSHQAKWMAWAQGQVEAAWDRLRVAGGGSTG